MPPEEPVQERRTRQRLDQLHAPDPAQLEPDRPPAGRRVVRADDEPPAQRVLPQRQHVPDPPPRDRDVVKRRAELGGQPINPAEPGSQRAAAKPEEVTKRPGCRPRSSGTAPCAWSTAG